ncbi:MAG: GNAT family N-acetyltransferase [Candidatus Eremiobacter antarcticus]|nr:GNAT family N-acetyltransferase [Candidatus Eremiobacteraeota bacterium]
MRAEAPHTVLTLALARRLEGEIAYDSAEVVENVRRLMPHIPAVSEEIAGGVACFTGIESPFSQAIGLGLHGAVSEADIERLERFYLERGSAVLVELCPLADPSFTKLLARRGFYPIDYTNVMTRVFQPADSWRSASQAFVIEQAGADELDLLNRTVAEGFAETDPVSPELLEVMLVAKHTRGVESYLARVGGKPVAGASMSVDNRLAALFGASTLAAYRGLGIQTALIQARLARGLEAGCDLALCVAAPGSASHRNLERQGFTPAYTRIKFEKRLRA